MYMCWFVCPTSYRLPYITIVQKCLVDDEVYLKIIDTIKWICLRSTYVVYVLDRCIILTMGQLPGRGLKVKTLLFHMLHTFNVHIFLIVIHKHYRTQTIHNNRFSSLTIVLDNLKNWGTILLTHMKIILNLFHFIRRMPFGLSNI